MRWSLVVVVVALGLIPACHHGPGSHASASCAEVATHVHGMLPPDDHGTKVSEIIATRCEKDGWPGAARACIMDTKTLHDGHHCKDRLSPEQHAGLDGDLAELEKSRAREAPPECERYKRLVDKMASCDKLPQATRDAFKQAFEAMSQGWKNFADMPSEAKRAVIDACHQASEAVEHSIAALCQL